MNDEIELKPCPFCGGKAEMVVQQLADGTPTHYGVCCDSCYQGTWIWHKTEAEAAAMWNRRTGAR